MDVGEAFCDESSNEQQDEEAAEDEFAPAIESAPIADVQWMVRRLRNAEGKQCLEKGARVMLQASRSGAPVCGRTITESLLMEAFSSFPDLDRDALE